MIADVEHHGLEVPCARCDDLSNQKHVLQIRLLNAINRIIDLHHELRDEETRHRRTKDRLRAVQSQLKKLGALNKTKTTVRASGSGVSPLGPLTEALAGTDDLDLDMLHAAETQLHEQA